MENDDKSHSAYHLIRDLLIVHYESWFIRFQVLFDNKNVDQPRGGMGFPTLKTEKHGIVQKKKYQETSRFCEKQKFSNSTSMQIVAADTFAQHTCVACW